MGDNIENAAIESTMLGVEDHGILTFRLTICGQGWGQRLGGYALDSNRNGVRTGFGPGLVAIREILDTLEVGKWESLPGTLIRVRRGLVGTRRPPVIGHILKDKWFDLAKHMKDCE